MERHDLTIEHVYRTRRRPDALTPLIAGRWVSQQDVAYALTRLWPRCPLRATRALSAEADQSRRCQNSS